MRSTAARVSRGIAARYGTVRGAADLRRGDDGVSAEPRRSATALWREAGPDDTGEDYWRRVADGGVRRTSRHHEESCASGAGVPSRDAGGESCGGDRRDRDAAA